MLVVTQFSKHVRHGFHSAFRLTAVTWTAMTDASRLAIDPYIF